MTIFRQICGYKSRGLRQQIPRWLSENPLAERIKRLAETPESLAETRESRRIPLRRIWQLLAEERVPRFEISGAGS